MNGAFAAVLQKSQFPSEWAKDKVKGYDFNEIKKNGGNIDYDALLNSLKYSGYQATSVGQAIDEVNRMVRNFGEILNELIF